MLVRSNVSTIFKNNTFQSGYDCCQHFCGIKVWKFRLLSALLTSESCKTSDDDKSIILSLKL